MSAYEEYGRSPCEAWTDEICIRCGCEITGDDIDDTNCLEGYCRECSDTINSETEEAKS